MKDHDEIRPGDTVRHKLKRHADSDFVGYVGEVKTTRGVGYTYTTVHVRWIKDNDDPSDGMTAHTPQELEQVATAERGER